MSLAPGSRSFRKRLRVAEVANPGNARLIRLLKLVCWGREGATWLAGTEGWLFFVVKKKGVLRLCLHQIRYSPPPTPPSWVILILPGWHSWDGGGRKRRREESRCEAFLSSSEVFQICYWEESWILTAAF